MRVYRAERYGVGPWSQDRECGILPFKLSWDLKDLCKAAGLSPWYHSGLPTPSCEGIDWEDTHICAASSIQQFDEWFPAPLRQLLGQLGFITVVYEAEVAENCIGWKQVMFDPTAASIVQILDIETMTPLDASPVPCVSLSHMQPQPQTETVT